jgi:hypothetical protein
MGRLSMELYLKNLSKRYRAAGRVEQGLLLEELCASKCYWLLDKGSDKKPPYCYDGLMVKLGSVDNSSNPSRRAATCSPQKCWAIIGFIANSKVIMDTANESR